MRFIDERTQLEVIPSDECLRLLETQYIGRVGVNLGGRPIVLPVNYVVHDGRPAFRTGEGTKFDAAVRGEFVAFEIDDVDEEAHEGWSVVVTGTAEEVTDSDALEEIEQLGLQPWVPGPTAHVVRIKPATVTGRRITRPS